MKTIILIFSILPLLSCGNDNEQLGSKKKFTFQLNKKKHFDNTDNYFVTFLSQTDTLNGKRVLYRKRIRSGFDGIDILNLDIENQEQESIKLSDEHLRHLKRLRGFYVKNIDSIFLIGITKILIINKSGKIIYENHFNHPKEDNYFPIGLANDSKPFVRKDAIFFIKMVDMDPSNELYDINVLMKYDYINNVLTEFPNTSYPKSYYDKCWVSLDLDISHTLNNSGELIFSYPISDSLFVYSLEQKKIIKRIFARSKYKTKNVEDVRCDKVWDNKEYYKHSYENFIYTDLIYNKHLNIYYRIMHLPRKEYNLNKMFNSLNNSFVITVLDEHLNIIHESRIFNDTPAYVPFDYFVTKEGLWISTNNPDNPEYDEDKLSFELFELNAI